jgi:hypothetical protein
MKSHLSNMHMTSVACFYIQTHKQETHGMHSQLALHCQISARRPAILTEVYRRFPQTYQASILN